jgi:hypothetical protein
MIDAPETPATTAHPTGASDATRKRRSFSTSEVLHVFARDGGVCRLCGTAVKPGDQSLDHIVPWSRGGSDDLTNLQLAHRRCNSAKGNRDRLSTPTPAQAPQRRTPPSSPRRTPVDPTPVALRYRQPDPRLTGDLAMRAQLPMPVDAWGRAVTLLPRCDEAVIAAIEDRERQKCGVQMRNRYAREQREAAAERARDAAAAAVPTPPPAREATRVRPVAAPRARWWQRIVDVL